MKDALGHGSEDRGGAAAPAAAPVATHAAAVNALPAKGGGVFGGMSEQVYHATMPAERFTGGVQDLLGLWSGSQKPEPLSASEKSRVDEAYAKRENWRDVARELQDNRRGYSPAPKSPDRVQVKYHKVGMSGEDY